MINAEIAKQEADKHKKISYSQYVQALENKLGKDILQKAQSGGYQYSIDVEEYYRYVINRILATELITSSLDNKLSNLTTEDHLQLIKNICTKNNYKVDLTRNNVLVISWN